MSHDWQTLLGFTSFWSAAFNTLAYIGLLVSTWGILDKKRQPYLFLTGVMLLWAFAVFVGNPIFMGAQSIVLAASLMRVLNTPDSWKLTAAIAVLILVNMARRGDLSSEMAILGLTALLGLTFGVVFSPGIYGNISFVAGGGFMAYYSYLVWSLPFLLLNIPFTLAALWEIVARIENKKSV
ncbi:MAG: hypothetical protein HYW91_00120 [Candidatus Sungbacteria bacterium]|nr:hypothetical protein [Candidatus Sungbacteria bacterium]